MPSSLHCRCLATAGVSILLLQLAGCGAVLHSMENKGLREARAYTKVAKELLKELKSVRDASSARRGAESIGQLYTRLAEHHTNIVEYESKNGGKIYGNKVELERILAEMESVSDDVGNQVIRIRNVPDLPNELWAPIKKASYIILGNVYQQQLDLKKASDPALARTYAGIRKLFIQEAADRIVEIQMPPLTNAEMTKTTQRLNERLPKGAQVFELGDRNSLVYVIGPVSMNEVVAAVDFGEVVERNDELREIDFTVDLKQLDPDRWKPRPGQEPSPEWSPATLAKWQAAIEEHGGDRVAMFKVVNAEELRSQNLSPREWLPKFDRFGFQNTTMHFDRDTGWVAPVDNFRRFCLQFRPGQIETRNEEAMLVHVRLEPTGGLANRARRRFATGGFGIPVAATGSTDAAATAWPTSGSIAQSYRKNIAKYGKDRVVRFTLTNRRQMSSAGWDSSQLTDLFFALDKGIRTINVTNSHGMVAPIDDLDAFCDAIDFARVVSRNESSGPVLKLELIPSALNITQQGDSGNSDRFGAPAFAGGDSQSSADRMREAMEQALKDAPPEARAQAREAFEKMYGDSAGRQSHSDKALGSSDLPNSDAPDYHAQLAKLMIDEQGEIKNEQAIDELLQINPTSVWDKQVRKQIARNFRDLALADKLDRRRAADGLGKYGGKYSVPLLIKLSKRANAAELETIFKWLAEFKDPRGAVEVVSRLDHPNREELVKRTLIAMGPIAEQPLQALVRDRNPRKARAAIAVLAEIGTSKSYAKLREANNDSDFRIRNAARDALKKIERRMREGL